MKTKYALLIGLSVASSVVLAQSKMKPGDWSPVQVQPAPAQAQPEPAQSGASGAQSQTDAGAPSFIPDPPPAPMSSVQPQTENGITYLCGGVGADETAQMKKVAGDYDLMLTFATRKGNYLANVNVDIADARGNAVLQTTCDAPIMLVDFPKAGTYKVRAETAGYTLTRTARISNKGGAQPVALLWPQQVADVGEAPAPASGSSGNGSSSNGSASGTR